MVDRMETDIPSTSLIERTLDVIEAVAALRTASIPDIQRHCALPTTTTHRIVQSLVSRGFLLRIGRADYRLGTAVVGIASAVSHRSLLPLAARPHLQALSKLTRSHVHLGVLEDGMVTYLLKQPYGKVRLHSAEGAQLEAYCSALGKVLLSGLLAGELDEYLGGGDFIALTPRTIVDAEALRCEIGAVGERGWAMDDEEIAFGLRCLATPIADRAGKVLAAVSISTVSKAPKQVDIQAFLPDLLAAAEAISAKLFPAEVGR
jgi:DNA-binding IclR family transcriptional regulator